MVNSKDPEPTTSGQEFAYFASSSRCSLAVASSNFIWISAGNLVMWRCTWTRTCRRSRHCTVALFCHSHLASVASSSHWFYSERCRRFPKVWKCGHHRHRTPQRINLNLARKVTGPWALSRWRSQTGTWLRSAVKVRVACTLEHCCTSCCSCCCCNYCCCNYCCSCYCRCCLTTDWRSLCLDYVQNPPSKGCCPAFLNCQVEHLCFSRSQAFCSSPCLRPFLQQCSCYRSRSCCSMQLQNHLSFSSLRC